MAKKAPKATQAHVKKAPTKWTELDVLIVLRQKLGDARNALGEALPLSDDQAVVDIGDEVDDLERKVTELLGALESHWPTVDQSGRCEGCDRCHEPTPKVVLERHGLVRMLADAADTIEELLGDDAEMPGHERTIEAAEATIARLRSVVTSEGEA